MPKSGPFKNNPSPDPFLSAPRCLRCDLAMSEFGICPPCQETGGKWIPLPPEDPDGEEQRELGLC